ncbi:Ig-like domain-containing protein [Escherichia coli]
MTFIADVRTAQIAELVVIKDGSAADGVMANMLRARVTDAFGNALAGQTVSVLAGNGATTAPTVTTQPDGTVEISVTSQTAGISAVTASINNSSQSRNVTFIADVRTAQIADLVVIKDGSEADGATANTLRARVTDAFGNALAGQTVSVTAGNGATVAPTVTTQPDGTAGDQCHQPDGGSQCSHRQHQQQQPEPGCDVYRRYQHGADRGSGGH